MQNEYEERVGEETFGEYGLYSGTILAGQPHGIGRFMPGFFEGQWMRGNIHGYNRKTNTRSHYFDLAKPK